MRRLDLSPHEIANAMGVSESQAWHMARNMPCYFDIPRTKIVKGKERMIRPPKPHAREALRRLHKFIQRNFRPHPVAHGGVKGKSCITSARRHTGRRFVVTRDVKDCYPSVNRKQLQRALVRQGFRSDVARLLSGLFTVDDELPQGSPVSGDALNFYMRDLDQSVSSCAGRISAGVSRCADDIVMSVDDRVQADIAGDLIEKEIQTLGLQVNRKKRASAGLQSTNQRQRVHNLTVNAKGTVAIVPEQSQRAVQLALDYVRGARRVTPDSIETLAIRRQSVLGWRCHTSQADKGPAHTIRCHLNTGDRLVRQELDRQRIYTRHGKWWIIARRRNEPRRIAQLWARKLKSDGL